MTNHVHLLVTAHALDSCAILMKSIGQLYAQYVNKNYKRTGNLWEGRFKSCLVQSESYLLVCHRYIELNPVRAGLAQSAALYPWSSFQANACGASCDYLTPHDEYLRLGAESRERQATYRDLFGTVAAPEFDEIRRATNAGYVFGDKRFKSVMARAVGRRVEHGIPGRPARQGDTSGSELFPG